MKTDKQIHSIFSANPQWLFELTGVESPGPCQFKSVAVKSIEQTADGVIVPEEPTQRLTVVEVQFYLDPAIYLRVVIEMAMIQQQSIARPIEGMILFLSSKLDPRTEPWCRVVRAFSLIDLLESLERRDPIHPLVAVFRPLVIDDQETLQNEAGRYYNLIKTSQTADSIKHVLLEVFLNWLTQRFSDRGKKEIENMLIGELPDVRDTQLAKELIQIGKVEGRAEGKLESRAELLVLLMKAKFGDLAPEIVQRIESIHDLDRLDALALRVASAESIDQLGL